LQVRKVDWTTNAEWFNVQQGSAAEADMKAQLHRGSMKDLNVYSAAPRGTGGEAIAGVTKLPMFAKVLVERQPGCMGRSAGSADSNARCGLPCVNHTKPQ
jgi:hypothetical protein